jgi:hypothetical protein
MTEKHEPRWDRDIARGAQAELFVDDLVKMLKKGTGQIEIKRDAWWPHTSRLFVELECFRKGEWRPSGLTTTGAKIWLFVAPHGFFFGIATDHLRAAVDYAVKRDVRNGNAQCETGSHPTRGVYVYNKDYLDTRDMSLDEH